MNQQKTARERAERALRHMPIMLIAREAVITVVEVEIKSAISDTLEEAASILDRAMIEALADNDVWWGLGLKDQATAIRALKDQET